MELQENDVLVFKNGHRKEHTTIHNLTDTLIRELIKNGNVKFDGGKYYVCKNK